VSGVAYADASALVKLVLVEAETPAVYRWFTESTHVMTSRVGVIETVRASSRRPHDSAHLAVVLADLHLIELDASVASVAASIGSPTLRTLDAIHIASAMAVAADLDAFVTYDDRMAEAARALGLPVIRPA
jgi:predicted nucleic acid-binding protein